jgi:hypothetical protein
MMKEIGKNKYIKATRWDGWILKTSCSFRKKKGPAQKADP